MQKNIIQYYNAYNEDLRLQATNTKRIEFITTASILNEHIQIGSKILDLGAGTGAYSFYFAEQGHDVTATDLTPKHVEIMKRKFQDTPNFQMDIRVADARSLVDFPNDNFDVVLCLGPLYHILDIEQQHKCISESLRVLKTGGIFAIAYVSRLAIFPYLVKENRHFLTQSWIERIVDRGYTKAEEEDCFWTDAYFHMPEEIENLMANYPTQFVDHAGTDGLGPLFSDVIDDLTDDEYEVWVKYHLKTCREKSIIGYSNHALYVCRKG